MPVHAGCGAAARLLQPTFLRFWHVRAGQVLAGQEASQSKPSTGVKASTEAKRGQVYSLGQRQSRSAHGLMGYILLPFCNCGRVGNLLCYSVVYSVSADYRGERGWSVRTMAAAAHWVSNTQANC